MAKRKYNKIITLISSYTGGSLFDESNSGSHVELMNSFFDDKAIIIYKGYRMTHWFTKINDKTLTMLRLKIPADIEMQVETISTFLKYNKEYKPIFKKVNNRYEYDNSNIQYYKNIVKEMMK
jgi:hypothetical protein